MNILAFDTSSPQFILALRKGDKVVAAPPAALQKTLSTSIIPRIEQLLKTAALPVAKLDGFAVGLGPGSFTSLRVGVATAKGLAAATGKPIVGIPGLDILAENVRDFPEPVDQVCCLIDARRGLVYGVVYALKGRDLIRKTPYVLTSLADVLKYVKGRVAFLGDAVTAGRAEILKAAKASGEVIPVFADESAVYPRPDALLRLAEARFAARRYDDVDRLVPLYLYPEDCQVRR